MTTLRLLATQLDALLANEPVFVSTQDPIQLNDRSEPEPDLAIIQGTVLDYADQHPRPEQVVEVADSASSQDCEVKYKLYAQAGIAGDWVVDLSSHQLHVFTRSLWVMPAISSSPNPIP